MPYPGRTVTRTSTYDGRWSDIDEDFVNEMQDLFRYLFGPKKLTVKKINGVSLKPADLLIFINTYVENFKNDSMPEATNIYESTLESQFRILTGKSYDVYVDAVASYNSELHSEENIDKLHASAKAKALQFFSAEKKFGSYSEGLIFRKDLQNKIEEGFIQWKKVSMNYLRILSEQKNKTDQQNAQVQQAQLNDEKAKNELQKATEAAEEARKALEEARSDTEEARRQAKELAEKWAQADKDRAEAIAEEKKTKEWLDKMSNDKAFFESQYNELKQQAGQGVGQALGDSQNERGFVHVLNSFTKFAAAAAPFITALGSLFG